MVTVHTGAETIQGRKIFKDENYSWKYGMGPISDDETSQKVFDIVKELAYTVQTSLKYIKHILPTPPPKNETISFLFISKVPCLYLY